MRLHLAVAVLVLLSIGTHAVGQPSTSARKARDLYISADFKGAQGVLESAARDDDPDAQSLLAYLYLTGFAGTTDPDKARSLALRAAKLNNGIALHVLYLSYWDEKNEAEFKKYLELSFRPLLEAALRDDVVAQGLLASQILMPDASIPEGVWTAMGKLANRISPAARQNPEQHFAAAAARRGFWLGYRVLGAIEQSRELDAKAFGPEGAGLYELRDVDDSRTGIRFFRRAALLGDPVAIQVMDASLFVYSREQIVAEQKFEWGKNPGTDREDTSVGIGMFHSFILLREFKSNPQRRLDGSVGEFSGNCARATDAVDHVVSKLRRMKAPLTRIGVFQAMSGKAPRMLTGPQRRALLDTYGDDGNLGAVLVDFASALYKVRVACDKDLFFAKVIQRLSD